MKGRWKDTSVPRDMRMQLNERVVLDSLSSSCLLYSAVKRIVGDFVVCTDRRRAHAV